ncbi:acyl-CoA dehydrogenase [Thermosporothrix hazakensis]|jgi:acyl-CoA dehydrogenase|uniref:Acyl-CoA dehydrogenase n=2 Tax=Thermosporothrix TaxID=768650 RepID=A0A326UD34_THEHA|nr:acyl-CoA dehydrogenase family protein [Thermosporothrix hazakensis]PZW36236.1 acyl-CoA dehydrogenase [Thermosporothrix hazakensis]BBH88699.1 acyl-CoA dehydrogenase [Thermosporothrix sp. COM3]GCE46885.1 acyl-CoA dehydrogenase [Thermosporothrix hazakensis]
MLDFTLSKEQEAFRDYVHQIALEEMRPVSLECDRTETIPEAFFWQMQKRLRGGADGQARQWIAEGKAAPGQEQLLSMLGYEELAWGDAALATALPGPGLAYPPLMAFGTVEQQQRFLSLYEDDGLHWGALALTEPGCGSDVSAIATTARREGNAWVLNGQKQFITNGARADLIITFATVNKAAGRGGLLPFVVPGGTPGLKVGRIEKKMGLRASQTAELLYEECRIPEDHLLGALLHAGRAGFKAAMRTLDATRPMVGALAVGLARAAHEEVTQWLKEELPASYSLQKRRELLEQAEELGYEIQMARLLVWRAAWMADRELANSKEASMCKAYAGELVMKVTTFAARVVASGEMTEARLFLEKWFRDAKIFDIFEGTAQIQRLVIARRLFPEVTIP